MEQKDVSNWVMVHMGKHEMNDPDYDRIVKMLGLRFRYLELDNEHIHHKTMIKDRHTKLNKLLSKFYDDELVISNECELCTKV